MQHDFTIYDLIVGAVLMTILVIKHLAGVFSNK